MSDELNEQDRTLDDVDEGEGQEAPPAQEPAAQDRPAEEAAVLEIATEISPPKLIRIGDEDYKLLNFGHLSPEQETAVTANFARFQKVYNRLANARSDADAQREAGKLRAYREKLIVGLTTIPRDVLRGLSGDKQGQLLTAVQNEIGAEVEVDDDDDGELG